MSYVVLSPFIAYAFYWGAKDSFKRMAKYLVYFGLGSLSTALLVIPTFIFYGIGEKGMGGSTNNIVFTPANFFEIGNLVLRLFSFASFEFNRFIGLSTEEKMTIFKLYPWTIPSILLVAITGFAQVGLMLFQFFKYKGQQTDMKFMKWLLLFTVGFLWLSFLFSAKDPASHTIYLFLPLIMVFYFLSLEKIIHVKWMIPFITVFYVSCFTFHLVMGIEKHQKVSFITQLPKVQDAFKQHKYTVLGIRRSDLKGCCY
jgi:hypothetical protein